MIRQLPEKKQINEEHRGKGTRTNHIRRKLEEWLVELLSRNDTAADITLCNFLGIEPSEAVAGIGGFKELPAKPWYVEHLEDNGTIHTPRTRHSLGGRTKSSGQHLDGRDGKASSGDWGNTAENNNNNNNSSGDAYRRSNSFGKRVPSSGQVSQKTPEADSSASTPVRSGSSPASPGPKWGFVETVRLSGEQARGSGVVSTPLSSPMGQIQEHHPFFNPFDTEEQPAVIVPFAKDPADGGEGGGWGHRHGQDRAGPPEAEMRRSSSLGQGNKSGGGMGNGSFDEQQQQQPLRKSHSLDANEKAATTGRAKQARRTTSGGSGGSGGILLGRSSVDRLESGSGMLGSVSSDWKAGRRESSSGSGRKKASARRSALGDQTASAIKAALVGQGVEEGGGGGIGRRYAPPPPSCVGGGSSLGACTM